MTTTTIDLLPDLAEFARRHVASRDIDPVYPVLAELERDDPFDIALARSLLYVAYYNLASSETAWSVYGHDLRRIARDPALLRLPTGTERRAHRSPAKLAQHLGALADLQDSGYARIHPDALDGELHSAWIQLRARLQTIWGNGRWASYKTAEILWKVNDYDVEAIDMGNDGSSGPLEMLHQLAEFPRGNVEAADLAALDLKSYLADSFDVDLGIEELETVLCDFGSMMKGAYYVGHDIDLMLEQTFVATPDVRDLILAARAKALPDAYLGELWGWTRRDRWLARRWLLTGVIGDRAA